MPADGSRTGVNDASQTAAQCRYLQGIKFYKPELAKDTPDAVERDGLQAVLNYAIPKLGLKGGLPILDTGATHPPGLHVRVHHAPAPPDALTEATIGSGWCSRLIESHAAIHAQAFRSAADGKQLVP